MLKSNRKIEITSPSLQVILYRVFPRSSKKIHQKDQVSLETFSGPRNAASVRPFFIFFQQLPQGPLPALSEIMNLHVLAYRNKRNGSSVSLNPFLMLLAAVKNLRLQA